MLDFDKTVRGARYFDHDLPASTKAMNRLAAAMEEQNRLTQEPKTEASPAVDVGVCNGRKVSNLTIGKEMVFVNFEDGSSISIAYGEHLTVMMQENGLVTELSS
jgi:hypothetical protein